MHNDLPFTQEQIVRAAEALILSTGKYAAAYREWLALADADKTYHNFVNRFTTEYQIQNEMAGTTAEQAGYHANMATTEPSLQSAVSNFAEATASDREAFRVLTDTNAALQRQVELVQQQNDALAQQIHVANAARQQQLFQPAPPVLQHQQSQFPRVQTQNPPQPPTYSLPPPNPASFPPPMPPPAPTYAPTRRSNRRNCRNNRRPPRQQPPLQNYAPFQPPTYQPSFQPPILPQQQTQPGPTQPSNFTKYFHNWNYCFTHGYDVDDEHTSMTCRNPAPNHHPYATRNNPMGGSQRNRHRTILPTQQNQHF